VEPTARLRELENSGDYTARLALVEEVKMLPLGDVWNYYCLKQGVPVGADWLGELREYEKNVTSKR
jgi:L-rhamnose isomerase